MAGLPPRFYKDYECKTSGHRRLIAATAAARRRLNRLNLPADHTCQVSLPITAADDAIEECRMLAIQKEWLEVFGDRLVEHLERLPVELKTTMLVSDLKMFKSRKYPRVARTQAK